MELFTWDPIVDYLTFEFGLFLLFLFVVKITDNSVGDAGTKQISNALITNTSLRELDLSRKLLLFRLN